ncbi:MAG: B12-binding domain-containing radical SAM protein, partial [Clostridia bacterium]|nr:B12-binding domain-containing radical SAM protein [Clostridia bacterium]
MKVLLTTLNSKYVHSNLSLKYLYLAGKHVCDGLDIKEYTINNSRDYVFTELVTADYDAVCFSCYIW